MESVKTYKVGTLWWKRKTEIYYVKTNCPEYIKDYMKRTFSYMHDDMKVVSIEEATEPVTERMTFATILRKDDNYEKLHCTYSNNKK